MMPVLWEGYPIEPFEKKKFNDCCNKYPFVGKQWNSDAY